ncbi:MAG: alpha-hydroxy-acid oxidizing protein [Candidatus Methanoperedens sp.]|nr:alpha-hydroxy-acid oxidizing protein [Candidatus Methanoperedens sp.]MCZ7394812.1 alpha-hydroxy-acid oxidizing protein [Candidatus Methanoperedens sp.]
MVKWLCAVCNIYVYDEEKGDPLTGISPATAVSEFPDSWRCPVCGATRDRLVQISEEEYWQKAKAYTDFTGKKEQIRSILVGVDNPETAPELRQEYGVPLGLRGIGQGLTYLNNLKALSKYRLKNRLITQHGEPVIETTFLGKKISMPVLGAPMSGLSYVSNITEEDFAYNILAGCKVAGTIGFTGNTSRDYEVTHPAIAALKKVKGHGVNIFKPQSQDVLLDLIRQSGKEKAIAVGIDIDGAGSVNFTLAGKPVFRKTVDELRELKKSTKLPFIIKGIMCEEDALAAVDAGADVIGISNHGGRVLDSGPGVADVLPEIVKAVREAKKGKEIVITADGGIRTGFDVVKMLALGADFVLVGRPLAREAVSSGVEGVKRILEYIKTDVRIAMIMTSCNNLKDINETILVS